MDWDKIIVRGFFTFCGAIVLFFVFVMYIAVQDMRLARFCLSKGYPQARYYWRGESYCIKRLDQTDIVIPTDKLR